MDLNELPGPDGSFLRPCQLLWFSTNIQRLQLRTQYWMSHIHVMNKLILFFIESKGQRQGWSSVGVVVTVRMLPPLHVWGLRGQTEILLLPQKALDLGQIQSPFPLRRSLLPAGERPLLLETDRERTNQGEHPHV